jgi:beta-galactosidase
MDPCPIPNKTSPDEIRVFSNCDEVALRINGKLVARQQPDSNPFSINLPHPPFTFRIPGFEPGTLKATGFIKGKKVAETSQTTAGKAVAIELKADISGMALNAGTPDLVFIYASLIDANGVVVNRDSLPVRFTVKGNAELIGDNPIRAEAGIATMLLKTTGVPGTLTVTAEAAGIKAVILAWTLM